MQQKIEKHHRVKPENIKEDKMETGKYNMEKKSEYFYKIIIPYNNRDQEWPEQTSINNRAFIHYLNQPFTSNEGDIITVLFGCGELIDPANVNCTLFACVI